MYISVVTAHMKIYVTQGPRASGCTYMEIRSSSGLLIAIEDTNLRDGQGRGESATQATAARVREVITSVVGSRSGNGGMRSGR